ncbi:helix-turn-helix domain-containing protein [Paenibacillus plantarum]|nr:helix-turn-helix domain-containing protein [Paenibacillus plantarum]
MADGFLRKLIPRNSSGMKSVIVPFFWSYIAILMLAVMIGAMLYWKAKNVVEITVGNTNAALLEQLREAEDSRLKELDQLEQQIAFHPKLQLLLSNGEKLTDADVYSAIEFSKDLQRYRNISPFVDDFYVYITASEMMIGPETKTTPSILFDHVYRFENKDAVSWVRDFREGSHVKTFLPAMTIQTSDASKRIIPYMRALPLLDRSSNKGMLFVMIDEDKFRSLLQKLARVNRGDIYILNKDNQIISSTKDLAKGQKLQVRYEEMSMCQGKLEKNWDDQHVVVSYTSSEVNDWKYVYAVPYDVFMDRVAAVKRWALAMLILAILGGVSISLYLTYRNYVPVRDVLNAISKHGTGGARDGISEYEWIKTTIESAQLTESKLRGLLSRQAPIIRVNFLSRLVRGYVESSELKPESLQFIGLTFVSNYYAVMMIEVNDQDSLGADGKEREWPFVSFIIANIADELAGEQHLGFSVELERGRIAILMNLNEERTGQWDEDLRKIAGNLVQVLKSRFHLALTIGISGIQSDANGIGEAYRDALKALDYQSVQERKRVIVPSELKDLETYYYYPLELELQLVNLVKSGDYAKVEKLLDEVFKENFINHHITPELSKCLFFNVTSTLLKVVQVFPDSDGGMVQRFQSIGQWAGVETAESMFDGIKEQYRLVCTHLKENRSDRSERMLEQINRYIRQHYGDNMLSIMSIADHLGITPPYLSAFFKKASGRNIADFIVTIRIEEAKHLLKDPTLTIAQVAIKVGYANDVGFIRVFKKYEGITPGQFRSSLG